MPGGPRHISQPEKMRLPESIDANKDCTYCLVIPVILPYHGNIPKPHASQTLLDSLQSLPDGYSQRHRYGGILKGRSQSLRLARWLPE